MVVAPEAQAEEGSAGEQWDQRKKPHGLQPPPSPCEKGPSPESTGTVILSSLQTRQPRPREARHTHEQREERQDSARAPLAAAAGRFRAVGWGRGSPDLRAEPLSWLRAPHRQV